MQNKIKFSELLTKKQYAIVAAFFAIIFFILTYTFFTGNNYPGKAPIRFEIKQGATLSAISEQLYKLQIIPSKTNFKLLSYMLGAEKRIKAGRYNIPNGLSYYRLISLFTSGEGDLLKEVVIYEGSTLKDIAYTLSISLKINREKFLKLCSDKVFLDSLKINQRDLEGYLFPGTYAFFEKSDNKELINKMLGRLEEIKKKYKITPERLHSILTMASIVEGETNKKEEMPVIAGVYYNRLKSGMKLQADPTIQYILGGKWKRLSYADLRVKSPYNTYMYKGLPPGPIGSPGSDAIISAINYSKHNYYFFVADGTGGHSFAENYKVHLENVKKYRTTLEQK